MKALRLSLGIVSAGAVLLGGTWASGAFAELAPGRQTRLGREPRYPSSAGELRLGSSLEVNGQPMELALFYTPDPPARVIRFYADALRARGLTPIISPEPALAHAAAFDPDSGLQRFINAVAQDGQTLVMVGATNPRKPPGLLATAEGASFPVPPGHRAYLGFRGTDPGTRSESAQFVSALTPREVASFYRAALGAQGFTEHAGAEGLLTLTKPGVMVSIALQKLDDRSGAAVFVTRTEGDF